MRAAADAPAELVELREPEALGIFDEHEVRVRHVDADLDDGGGDEHLGLAARKRSMTASFSSGAMRPCSSSHGSGASSSVHAAISAIGGLGLELLGFVDERVDDVGLPAGFEVFAEEARGFGAASPRRARR